MARLNIGKAVYLEDFVSRHLWVKCLEEHVAELSEWSAPVNDKQIVESVARSLFQSPPSFFSSSSARESNNLSCSLPSLSLIKTSTFLSTSLNF